MYTYEVNLLCHGKDCNSIVTGEPMETPEAGEESVKEGAYAEGWRWIEGDWFCAKCKQPLREAA
jgi:hypothetical protein